jgi:AraC-like DNA-binding protein
MQIIEPNQGHLSSKAFSGFADDICRQLFRVEVERKNSGDFAWGWRKHDFGEFQLTDLSCDPVSVSRSHSEISRGIANSYFVTLQLSGAGSVSQSGRHAILEPGDFTLLDGDLPYRIEFDVPVQRLILKIPKGIIARRLDIYGSPLAHRFSGMGGINAVFANFLASLAQNSRTIDRRHLKILSGMIIDFLSASYEGAACVNIEQPVTTNHVNLIRRIQDHIILHLADPDLSPHSIAEQHRITERYLHSLFRSLGTTVTSWVRDNRLERCHADFKNSSLAKRTISETCFMWGFNDLAYFSRKFKEKYEISPRNVKAAALS